MNVLEAMSIFPKTAAILSKNQIKSLKVFETLEKNILAAGKDPDIIVNEINNEFEESKKPLKIELDKILDITEEASAEMEKLMEKKSKKGWSIRVMTHSPSPNKYAYAIDFEKRPAKDDIVLEKHGLKFFVGKKHIDRIKGLRIEFDKKENGFRFDKSR